jgi:two-component system, LytTR family, response regulator
VKLRTLIVDDESLAREGVRMLLEKDPDVGDVLECADGRDAVDVIRKEKPDLVFLDVQMPEMSGFDVVASVGVNQMPNTIFITAHDKYAVQAFEFNALDYLLKPYTDERFTRALERAKTQLSNSHELSRQFSALLDHLSGDRNPLERLVVKSAGRLSFVNVHEIDWIEAADTYVRLHVGREAHLIRGSLSALEARLDPARFLRIQRSIIVNLSRVKELHPLFHGEYVITLNDGTKLNSGRSYRNKLQSLLENPF